MCSVLRPQALARSHGLHLGHPCHFLEVPGRSAADIRDNAEDDGVDSPGLMREGAPHDLASGITVTPPRLRSRGGGLEGVVAA